MKIGITLGATLNLDNFNSGRVNVKFEDDYLEKDFQVQIDENGEPIDDPRKIAQLIADDLYTQVETILMDKIDKFVAKLMERGYV